MCLFVTLVTHGTTWREARWREWRMEMWMTCRGLILIRKINGKDWVMGSWRVRSNGMMISTNIPEKRSFSIHLDWHHMTAQYFRWQRPLWAIIRKNKKRNENENVFHHHSAASRLNSDHSKSHLWRSYCCCVTHRVPANWSENWISISSIFIVSQHKNWFSNEL